MPHVPRSTDAKNLLFHLREGGDPPESVSACPSEQLERARSVLQGQDLSADQARQLAEPLALALLEYAVERRLPEIAERFTHHADKAVQKAAKRALYRLRSLGVTVPEAPAAHAAPAAGTTPEAPRPRSDDLWAFITPISGNGQRAVLIPRPLKSGGLELFQVDLSDELGVTRLEVDELNRSSYRKMLRELQAARPPAAITLRISEALAEVSAATTLNLSSHSPLPEGFESFRRHVGLPEGPVPAELPTPEPDDAVLARNSWRLHEERELERWLPPMEVVRDFLQKVDEVMASPLFIHERQREEQLARVVTTTVERYFDEGRRRLYARRLWSMADFFARTHRPESAALARAEARRLFHSPVGTPSGFADTMFEKILTLTAAKRAPGPEAEVREGAHPPPPAEPRVPPGERRSPGGLILP